MSLANPTAAIRSKGPVRADARGKEKRMLREDYVSDSKSLMLFLTSALVLLIVPGPVVFFIVARSLEQGRVAGLVSTLGVGLGTLAHVAAAALGVSAIVMRSALAFSVVKYLARISHSLCFSARKAGI